MSALIAAANGNGPARAQQVSTAVSDDERQILMEFFIATGGERWTNHDGWGSSRSVCDWYGVVCGREANQAFVSGLDLRNNNLEGVIPPRLVELTRLQLLWSRGIGCPAPSGSVSRPRPSSR